MSSGEETIAIPGYRVVAEIGRGARANVYHVVRDGVSYACKVTREDMSGAIRVEEALRFRREAAALARLSHASLVRVVESGEWRSRPYLVMELVEGDRLDLLLRDEGPLPEDRAVTYARGLAGALAEVHRRGLVHRDIKPENVLVDAEHHPRVIDFGFVTSVQEQAEEGGEIIGSFLYAPPEQNGRLKRPVDGRSDLYSLGVLLYECLAGRPPFMSRNMGELIRMHAEVDAPDIRAIRPDVRPALAAIIAKLLRKEPDDRYQTGRGLLYDLEHLGEIEASATDGKDLVLGRVDSLASGQEVPLVGRKAELSKIERAMLAARGGNGSIVLVEGDPGMGKTRLVREQIRELRKKGGLVLGGKAQKAEQVPLGVLREAVDNYVAGLLRLPATEERERAVARLASAAGDAKHALGLFSRGLRTILEIEDAGAAPLPDPERFNKNIAQFVCQLARQHGQALLLVDDVQWMDDASTQVLLQVASMLKDAPLLVACTARNDPDSEAARTKFVATLGAALAERIVLRPLDTSATGELVAAHLGGHRIGRDYVERLHARADGNPFAIGELVRALLDAGAVTPTADDWKIDAELFAKLDLPSDVIELVISRVGTLSARTTKLLGAASVVGNHFESRFVRDVVDLAPEQLGPALTEAVNGNFVEHTAGDVFSFVHDRVREGLLARLEEGERAELHQRVAEVMEGQDDGSADFAFALARHYARGRADEHPEAVFRTSKIAGAKALGANLNGEAFEFLTRADALAPKLAVGNDVRFELSQSLGQACTRTGRVKDALVHFEAALPNAASRVAAARIHLLTAQVYQALWDFDGVASACQRALGTLGASLPTTKLARSLSTLWLWIVWWVLRGTGIAYGRAAGERVKERTLLSEIYGLWAFFAYMYRPDVCSDLVPRLLYVAHDLGARREAVPALAAASVAAGMRTPKTGVWAGEQAVKLADFVGDRALMAVSRRNLGWAYQMAGQWQRQQEHDRDIVKNHSSWFLARDFVAFTNVYAASQFARGHVREALEAWQRAFGVVEPLKLFSGMATCLFPSAACEAVLGRHAEAHATWTSAEQLRTEKLSPKDSHSHGWAAEWTALLRFEEGAVDGRFDEAITLHDSFGRGPHDWPVFQLPYYIIHARGRLSAWLAAADADKPEKRTKLDAALRELETIAFDSHRRAHLFTIRAAIDRAEGRLAAARKKLDRAERLAQEADDRWAAFELRAERARVLRALREVDESKASAEKAVELAVAAGFNTQASRMRLEFGLDVTAQRTAETTTAAATRRSATDHYLHALLQVSIASASTLDPTEQARAALDEIIRLLGADRAFLFLWDANAMKVRLQAGRDANGKDIAEATAYSSTVVKKVVDEQRPLIVTGTAEGALIGSASAVAAELQSIMAAPLFFRERFVGVIYLDHSMVKGLFTEEDFNILLAIANHIAIAVESARTARLELERKMLQQDMELTAAVQRLFLPREALHAHQGGRLAGMHLPADRCSGDWWWYETARDDSLLVLVGDVTGHGAAPAMVTAAVATGFRMTQSLGSDVPARLKTVNEQLAEIVQGEYRMTFGALHFAPKDGRLRFWSAGAPPALLLDAKGNTRPLTCGGVPLGASDFRMGEVEVVLAPGERAFLFTDGVSELELPNGRQFGMRRVARLLESSREQDLFLAARSMAMELKVARGDVPQRDDITLALLERE